jgi:hypothetical protein
MGRSRPQGPPAHWTVITPNDRVAPRRYTSSWPHVSARGEKTLRPGARPASGWVVHAPSASNLAPSYAAYEASRFSTRSDEPGPPEKAEARARRAARPLTSDQRSGRYPTTGASSRLSRTPTGPGHQSLQMVNREGEPVVALGRARDPRRWQPHRGRNPRVRGRRRHPTRGSSSVPGDAGDHQRSYQRIYGCSRLKGDFNENGIRTSLVPM